MSCGRFDRTDVLTRKPPRDILSICVCVYIYIYIYIYRSLLRVLLRRRRICIADCRNAVENARGRREKSNDRFASHESTWCESRFTSYTLSLLSRFTHFGQFSQFLETPFLSDRPFTFARHYASFHGDSFHGTANQFPDHRPLDRQITRRLLRRDRCRADSSSDRRFPRSIGFNSIEEKRIARRSVRRGRRGSGFSHARTLTGEFIQGRAPGPGPRAPTTGYQKNRKDLPTRPPMVGVIFIRKSPSPLALSLCLASLFLPPFSFLRAPGNPFVLSTFFQG